MIHRDIKPDNVLLKPDAAGARLNYRPILTDFGLAKLTASSESAVTEQQPIGTYPYMSPEQCLAEDVDQRSDIYSIGIVLYEPTVGRLPYNPKSIAEAVRYHTREPLPLPSALRAGFPSDLESVIVKALQKEPNKRYQTAADFAADLQSMLRPIADSGPGRRACCART
ncbi:MAG: serine/threonine protein kinase [Chloroflexi bacterium]|nr:serine/threonine protein kinase [Chloroflexota bacterium]